MARMTERIATPKVQTMMMGNQTTSVCGGDDYGDGCGDLDGGEIDFDDESEPDVFEEEW